MPAITGSIAGIYQFWTLESVDLNLQFPCALVLSHQQTEGGRGSRGEEGTWVCAGVLDPIGRRVTRVDHSGAHDEEIICCTAQALGMVNLSETRPLIESRDPQGGD